jgi:hypothetical protein
MATFGAYIGVRNVRTGSITTREIRFKLPASAEHTDVVFVKATEKTRKWKDVWVEETWRY